MLPTTSARHIQNPSCLGGGVCETTGGDGVWLMFVLRVPAVS